ncbi:hypothetical protein H0H93_004500 [Arthromyces matolae]|nr:hypothetical protein H0H93_004500 [Arthromyces matolae]
MSRPYPVSHMRPIIYSDAPLPRSPSLLSHPYSLDEFSTTSKERGEDLVLQFKLQRQQLDDLHQKFWLDSNTRFEAAKQAILSGLPPTATPLDKERTLSEFYTQWYIQEAPQTDNYTAEWRRRNVALIKLSARLQLQQFTKAVSNLFTLNK